MKQNVRTHPSSARLPREEQLALKLAAVAADPAEVSAEVTEMVINRLRADAASRQLGPRRCRAVRKYDTMGLAPNLALPSAIWHSRGLPCFAPSCGRKFTTRESPAATLNCVGSLALSPELLKAADIGVPRTGAGS